MTKKAAIIITTATEIGYQELHHSRFGSHATAFREVTPSEALLADLLYLVGASSGPEAARVCAALEGEA